MLVCVYMYNIYIHILDIDTSIAKLEADEASKKECKHSAPAPYVCVCVCVRVCAFVCVCLYIYIHGYIYIYYTYAYIRHRHINRPAAKLETDDASQAFWSSTARIAMTRCATASCVKNVSS